MNLRKTKYKQEYPLLFSPLAVGPLDLPNRLVALPVHTGFALPDGRVSPWMLDHYTRLAGSGVGLVVVANTAVSKDGVVSKYNLRADHDKFIPGLADLAAAIKKQGAVACIQLNHAGRFAKTPRPLLPSSITSTNLSFNIESLKDFMEFFPFEKRFGLTRYFLDQFRAWGHAMEPSDCERVINDFGRAAFRAVKAGFDMVELHGANGYLLCQYLSAFTNHLISGYGGDFAARTTFPLAVIKRVKENLPNNYPLGFRLLLREWVPGGITLPEALAFAKHLEQVGIAYLSTAAGTFNSIFSKTVLKKSRKTGYLRRDTRTLTREIDIPTIISGRVTTPHIGAQMIKDGVADLIGLGRPLRCDPDWVKKARTGTGKIRACINCNICLKRVVLEKGISCSQWPVIKQDRTDLEHQLLTRNNKAIWVVTRQKDVQNFKNSLLLDVPGRNSDLSPRILDLKGADDDQCFETVKDEIDQGQYGMVFMAAADYRPWKERVLHKIRGRVAALIGSSRLQSRIIVPLDLSDTSLLVMAFVKQYFILEKPFKIDFVHILSDTGEMANQRWEYLKSIVGIDANVPIGLVSSENNVVSVLNQIIHVDQYGTIVMGKRGLSGLKRWLLGSVSAGVLEHLSDQSLFLVD